MTDVQKLNYARNEPRYPDVDVPAEFKRFNYRRPLYLPGLTESDVVDELRDFENFEVLESSALSSAEAAVASLSPDDQELVIDAGGVKALYRDVQQRKLNADLKADLASFVKPGREDRVVAKADALLLRELVSVCAKLGLDHFGAPVPQGPGLLATLETWLTTDQRARSTAVKYRLHIRRLSEMVGDISPASLTVEHIRDFTAKYAALPNTRLLPLDQRKLTMPQLLALKLVSPDLPVGGDAQASKMLDYLRAYLKHVGRADLLGDAARPSQRNKHASKQRDRAFEPDDLVRILAEVELRCGSQSDITWWCWILAYSGMRPSEAAQLARSNVRQIRKIWAFEIDDLDDRRVKNSQSVRCLPVHPKLLERGLISFLANGSSRRLFATFVEDDKGDVANNPSRRLKRILQALNIKGSGAAGRFRHSFIDALRNAGLPYSIELGLVGHADDNKHHAGYGRGASLKAMAREIGKVDPCLD